MKKIVILLLIALSVLHYAQDRNRNQENQSTARGNLRLEDLDNSRKLDEVNSTLKSADQKIDKLQKKITTMEEHITRINYYLWIGGGVILVMLLVIMFRIIIPATTGVPHVKKNPKITHTDDDEAREKISKFVDELANLERNVRQENQRKPRRR